MTADNAEGQIDRLVKAGWLAMGISQSDLAEALDAVFKQPREESKADNMAWMMQVANAVDLPLVPRRSTAAGMDAVDDGLQALTDLCLLRAFCRLRDHRARRLIVRLIELIVRRQDRRGSAG